ncbi:MAG: DUF4197 domain-containing protein [Sedimenticola sp.]
MKYSTKLYSALSITCLLTAGAAHGGWQDLLKSASEVLGEQKSSTSIASTLSDDQVIRGLKEALSIGAEKAIGILSRDGGYLNDGQVRIPLPGMLETVAQGVRSLGQGALVDEFEKTMNRAAERAVPETLSIFSQAVRDMTLDDARSILNGGDSAATDYFKGKSSQQLTSAILPIIQQATREAGVTAAYKQLVGRAGFLSTYVDMNSLDLDRHVTAKALDGLFLKLAEQEQMIRKDPIARTTDLLKNVFGAYGR